MGGRAGKDWLLTMGGSPRGEGAQSAPLATGRMVVPSTEPDVWATGRIMPDRHDAHGLIPGSANVHLRGKRCGPLAADSKGLGLQGTMWPHWPPGT